MAIGGVLQSHGGDFSNGLVSINAGGSHESNPNDGVQLGVDNEGKPNLVEENETIFDQYVFSKRIKLDNEAKKKFHVGKNSDISYADLSKKLQKESEERPNDPISSRGLTKQMHDLANEQERQKAELQSKEARDMFESLPPEQQAEIMQQVAQEQQAAQQNEHQGNEEQPIEGMQEQPNEQQMMEQQQMEAPVTDNGEQINACGGKLNRFDKGGDMKSKIYNLLNLHTDSDFNNWLGKRRLAKIDDWDNILKNGEFIQALKEENPIVADAISRGYDFGNYKAPTGKYDLQGFNKILDAYDKSKIKGNVKGNYAVDGAFNLGKYKTIQDLEASPDYKAYTDYLTGAINRNKNIAFKYGDNAHSYDNIIWKDPNKKISKEDFDILNTLQHHINGTSINPEGVVPLWNAADKEGYSSLAKDADTLLTNYRNDGKGGIFHLTPDVIDRGKQTNNYVVNDNGTIEQIVGDVPKDWTNVGSFNWQTDTSDNGANYYKRPVDANANNSKGKEEETLEPVHKPIWGRYAGLAGPLVGLGMQMAGIGKPDYSRLDGSLDIVNGAPAMAHYKPIGNYLTYRPMDIWYEQNRMNANSRATDRAIMNNASPIGTKMAGLLANGYNSQIASGDLYRKALEYNDAQRHKVAEFNRGTDMYNADAFTRTSATNAQILNNNRQVRAQMAMNAARQRMAADAAWNQGIYGNVQGLFKGLGDWGKENAQHNMIADMAADGIFGNMSDKQNIGRGFLTRKVKKSSKGGKLNRKRGLTF